MEQFKYLQPIDQMARVSRAELGDRLDEILEIVNKDNVGYVITDEGKDDLLLCPVRWFDGIFDDDFGCIVNSALRYAIGRRTYMPSVVMSFIRKHIDVLDSRTISTMISNIEREAEQETLDQRDDWMKLRDDLKTHYKAMLQKDADGERDESR